MDGEGAEGKMRRAEIDTTAPFRSVKEAVMLFGERVLAGELYANKLKELQKEETETGNSGDPNVTAELEETRQSLLKAREESMLMATCLSSLQEELERTKLELRQMKEREIDNQLKQVIEAEIEADLKFVEDSTRIQVPTNEGVEFQKKRYVTFANPPSVARVMPPQKFVSVPYAQAQGEAVLERHPSLRKKKKKPLIPLIGGIFSRKKGGSEVASQRA
ncbi:hypothetical protein NMG60_11016144 [Bertholletia excelsa]